jgi:hypothetical protein
MTARIPIAFTNAVKVPAEIGFGFVLVGITWLSVTRRIPITAVARCLFTWRIERWTSTEARRLLIRDMP